MFLHLRKSLTFLIIWRPPKNAEHNYFSSLKVESHLLNEIVPSIGYEVRHKIRTVNLWFSMSLTNWIKYFIYLTIDISNCLWVLDQVVVEDNMYDRIYHNHHIIINEIHLLVYHNLHIQYNLNISNLVLILLLITRIKISIVIKI